MGRPVRALRDSDETETGRKLLGGWMGERLKVGRGTLHDSYNRAACSDPQSSFFAVDRRCPVFRVNLGRADHIRQYSVSAHRAAWEVKLEEDHTLIRHRWYHDWHRVEGILTIFRREVVDLTAEGWQIQSVNR